MIISDKNEQIAEKIMNDIGAGCNSFKWVWVLYTQKREVLYCVVSKNELFRLKNAITSVDPHAFVSVSEVNDVLGEGFTLDENKNPLQ